MFTRLRQLTTAHRKLAIVPLLVVLIVGATYVRPDVAAAAALRGPAGTTYVPQGATCTTEFNHEFNTRWTLIRAISPAVKKPIGTWAAGSKGQIWWRINWKEGTTWKYLEFARDSQGIVRSPDGYEYLQLPILNYYLPSSLYGRTLYVQSAVVISWTGGSASMNYVDEQATTMARQNYPIGMGNYAWTNWATGNGCLS